MVLFCLNFSYGNFQHKSNSLCKVWPTFVLFRSHSAIHLRQLPYDISPADLYDIFGRHGTIRQIRKGVDESTKGTAFVVYDEIEDAKNALKQLSGFHVSGRHGGILFEQTSLFLSKWRLRLDKSFVGGSLLDDFFEKIGSLFYFLSLKKCEQTFSHSTMMEINLFVKSLPKIFLLTGSIGSDLPKTVTFNVSIDKYVFGANPPASTCLNNGIRDLNNELAVISKMGRCLQSSLHNGPGLPPAILVSFGNVNAGQYYIKSNNGYDANALNQFAVLINLISRYIYIWDYEDIPVVSFFVSDVDSYVGKDSNMDSQLETINLKYILKRGYGMFFEMDFSSSLLKVDKTSLLRFLIRKRYGINEVALDYLLKEMIDMHSESIMALSNKELELVINEIDLIRIKDVLNDIELCNIPYTTSCGNFIALVPNGVKNDFFSVFLYYFNFVVGKLDKSIGYSRHEITYFSYNKGIGLCKGGLGDMIGCIKVISKIKNFLLPCILLYPEPSNFQLPVVFNEASGIIVSGGKGCGKSFLVTSIANSLNCGINFVQTADIFNATIGFLEKYLKEMINVCTRKRRFILVFEDIDQYLMRNNNTLFSLMFLFDLVSRSNKWMHSEIMIFGTSKRRYPVCANVYQWDLREIIDILNKQLIPIVTRFSNRVPIKISHDKVDQLIENVAFLIRQEFTPSVAVGIANYLGLFLLRQLLEYSDKTTLLDLESYFDIIYKTVLNIASKCCKF
ncbi:uncharacterized protein cubi_01042 [Cryptosporidium ubiquitum]|uniref:RRM domain-containing protein n=1 Tax=Cryptosporidium ubiquitum TaxID=857276 RepID=A0A1J4MJ23_9CRYT|nr:uncharacterized protein cubi_01042 [Cryptosporidium ubiquitum]OII74198.1 hypothetical protein cubi_01042 [Cryptosporidium ubiquitum]